MFGKPSIDQINDVAGVLVFQTHFSFITTIISMASVFTLFVNNIEFEFEPWAVCLFCDKIDRRRLDFKHINFK